MREIPFTPTPAAPERFSFQHWRENFLGAILNGAAALGIVAVAASFFTQTNPVYRTLYVVAYVLLLLVTFARLPYPVRAGFFLFLTYALGVSGLLETGIWGDVRPFFLALVVMAGLLFSPRAALAATGIGLVTAAVVGGLVLGGQLQLTSQNVGPGDLGTWLTALATLLVLSFVIMRGLQLFQNEFVRAQQNAEESLDALRSERSQLEDRVFVRTQELEDRTGGLRATAYIARQIAEIQDVPTLLNRVVQLGAERLGFYHVAIFLLDEDGKTAHLQAASSEEGQRMLEAGYQVGPGDRNPIASVLESRKPFRFTADKGRASTPDSQLPMTRSGIALPLSARGKLIGVIDLHSDKPRDFSEDDIDVLATMADQLSASIDNVRLLNETQAFLSQLEVLTSEETRATWKEFLSRRAPAYQYSPAGIKAVSAPKPSAKRGLRVPLRLRGQAIGTITLQRKETDAAWGERERDLVDKVATQVALALDNSRLIEESRRRAMQEQTVGEIAARLSRSLDIDTLLQTAARELGALPEVAELSVIIGEVDPKVEPAPGA